MVRTMGLNDDAWEKLFETHNILDAVNRDGQYVIAAKDIKKFREPRLMTKFDHAVNLPRLFQDNGLAILPISRGEYVISSFQAYAPLLDPPGPIQRVAPPSGLQSLLPQFITSEAIALNCAAACGILEDFLEDHNLVSTINGRMGSDSFSFAINTRLGLREVTVNNAQMEIDACYEGERYVSIFEAKLNLSDDFLVRQLYYPYRVWSRRVTKPIKTVFLVYSNGVFALYEYRFADGENYNSLALVKQKKYALAVDITAEDIWNLLQSTSVEEEPKVPFPQANSMDRVVNLTELLYEQERTEEEITSEYSFDQRQTRYYTDAGRYLGLIERQGRGAKTQYRLTPEGRRIMGLAYRERQLAFVSAMLKHKVFRLSIASCLEKGTLPSNEAIVGWMRQSNLYHVQSDNTFGRRASTVSGWLRWVLSLLC